MNFSETTIIKFVLEETPHELSTWNLIIVILVYMCVTSLKIVCPKVIILSQMSHGVNQNFLQKLRLNSLSGDRSGLFQTAFN